MNKQQRTRAAHASRRRKAADFDTSFSFGALAPKKSGKSKSSGGGNAWTAYTGGRRRR